MSTANAKRYAGTEAASLTLPPLPYADDALEPVITARTIGFHYRKHHAGYVNNLEQLVAGTRYADLSLEEIISATAGQTDKTAIFNNAAQIWNHTFYWNSMRPKGGGEPPAALRVRIEDSFGSMDACKKEARLSRRFAVRQRLGVARARSRKAAGSQDRQRQRAVDDGDETAAHDRRVGTCLLPRLPEPPRRLRERRARRAD